MYKIKFISERTDKRELLLLNSFDKKYILVEGKNDKLFYSYYYSEILKKKDADKIEFKECGGLPSLHKMLDEKRNKKKYNNYFAIVDKDSQKFWSNSIDLSLFNIKYTLFTDGYCLENYFFIGNNLPRLFKSLGSFMVLKRDLKISYLANLSELFKDFCSEFCNHNYYLVNDDYYKRSSVKHVNVLKRGDFETVQIIGDTTAQKYYDNIPSSVGEIHGKDILLAFILLVNYLDEKFKNKVVNMFNDKNSILDMPYQLMPKINGFRIKNLDKFIKTVIKT